MRRSSYSSKLTAFALTLLAAVACQAVAGIEDRTLDPNAGQALPSKQCDDYCTVVMEACTGDDAVYTTREFCLGVCATLTPGEDEDTTGNTVACRAFYANSALRETVDCVSAGPGGNGACGTDCEAYCQLYPTICPEDYKYGSTEDCLKFCGGLPERADLDVVTDHGGDTIECRLVHLSSATVNPREHCPHAAIPPSQPWCTGPAESAPTCEDYCQIQMVACTGALAQYESQQQCEDVCAALDPGTNEDKVGNTVGCRRYHAFSSTVIPTTHCSHSGPTGDGHCGLDDPEQGVTANCDSYCRLVAAACPDEFEATLGSPEECITSCVELDEAEADAKYAVDTASASTGLSCRVLYTARAFADETACASAVGGDQCE